MKNNPFGNIEEMMTKLAEQLRANQEEHIRDILGIPKMEIDTERELTRDHIDTLRYSIGHDFKAPEYIPPGVLCYIDDGVEECRANHKETWERVHGFFKREG